MIRDLRRVEQKAEPNQYAKKYAKGGDHLSFLESLITR
jgi:hypothetical protein